MKDMNLIPVRVESSANEFTTFIVAEGNIPVVSQISLTAGECDAFIVTLDGRLLSEERVDEIAAKTVKLPVGWVETFGPCCEYLHDRIDAASVSIGRQEKVGDGNPMTAWHEHLSNIDEIVSYIRTGGQGAAETKLVVVIGPEHSADTIARRIAQGIKAP